MWACLSAHVDQRRNGRCLAVVPALLILGMGMSSTATAAQWPTTSWVVLCSDSAESELTCENEGIGAAGAHRRELEAASRWLEDLGFAAPSVDQRAQGTDEASYFATIDEGELPKDTGGIYRPPDIPGSTGAFYLSPDIAGESIGAEATHELFHGVQQSYRAIDPLYAGSVEHLGFPPTVTDKPVWPDHRWIAEGTADAIRMAFGQHDGLAVTKRSPRFYDSPLHDACVGCDHDEKLRQVYATANFWLALGSLLDSRDRVQYFRQIWTAIGNDPDMAHQGLGAVDRGLRSVDGKGLYAHYPEFIAQYAKSGAYFQHVQTVHLRGVRDHYPPDLSTGNEKVVQPVAADAYRLTVQVPEGKSTELEVVFTEDHPNLHLIVDDQRLDAEGARRNVFRKPLEGRAKPYTFFVRAANVAQHAADTKEQAYELSFALKHPPQDCEFIADVSGAISGHFEGKAVVGFDTGTDGRTAKITDLTLESDGFNLKVGLRSPATVGEAATAKGDAFPVASSRIDVVNRSNEYAEPFIGPRFSGNEMQKMFGRNGDKDFVSINVHKSDVIPWGDLPIVLRRYLADTMGEPEIVGHGEQVGDVTVKGVVEGQLSQTRLIKGLAEKNQQIHFRARFKAQSEIYECDYDGFAEKMNRRMSRIPSDAQLPDGTQMPKQMKQMRGLSEQVNKKLLKDMSDLMPGGAEQMGQAFDKVQDKMSENMPGGMSERTKKQVQEQLDRIKEQMKKAQEDGS